MEAGVMNRPKQADVATLRQRLAEGVWLKPGEVAALFNKDRGTIDNWLRAGRIGYRRTATRHRECDPTDVRKLLDDYEQVRHGEGPAEPAG